MGTHHRAPTDQVQDLLDSLEATGLEILPEERAAIANAHQHEHLGALEHLISRALLLGSVEGQAATARRQIRHQRSEAELSLIESADEFPNRNANWVIGVEDSGSWSFRHTGCGHKYGSYDGPYKSAQAASDHHRRCSEVVNPHD